MVGLRSQETNKFKNFFELVQKEANKQNCVFYLETGCGNGYEDDEIECENLQGWLIPQNKAQEFENVWKQRREDDTFVEFFRWCEWKKVNNRLEISFEK